MPESYNERGFASYADGVPSTYGEVVRVYESSSATAPHIWLAIKGKAHLSGPPAPHAKVPYGIAPGGIQAHLTVEQAQRIHAALGEAIDAALSDERGSAATE